MDSASVSPTLACALIVRPSAAAKIVSDFFIVVVVSADGRQNVGPSSMLLWAVYVFDGQKGRVAPSNSFRCSEPAAAKIVTIVPAIE